jgi:3-oxoacyl-[acyl-carrier protein] reductase
MDKKKFDGKNILITGCRRGIGHKAVEMFANQGANLICCLRKEDDDFSRFIQKLSEDTGVRYRQLYFDLKDEATIKEQLKTLSKDKVRIDVLVNNAGMPAGGLMLMTQMAKLREVFQVNFFSQVLITQYIAKMMMKQKNGSIINMSSVVALDNLAGWTMYGASKAAIAAFTKTAACELAPFHIRVNAIAPGLIETEMGEEMNQKIQDEMLLRSDMHRKGRPEEIVNLMSFLASDESSFITGQLIRIDGGM